MTAREIMTYFDEIKEDIPDGVYLTLANLLKKKEVNKVSEYKLVEIEYIKTSIRRGHEEDNEPGDYVVFTQFRTKKVYFNKSCNNITKGDCFEFKNYEGLETIEEGFSEEDQLYHPTKKGNEISIAYDKYILISMKDC